MHIGLIAGAFKPLTKGHFALIQKASEENDVAYLFVSTKDRMRKGEHPLPWKLMHPVWKRFLEKAMPSNVNVLYTENPTTGVFDILERGNKNLKNNDVFTLYADTKDIKRYDNKRVRTRNIPNLLATDRIYFKPIDRSLTAGASGTKMRKALADSDLETFVSMLPEPVQHKGDIIFQMLGGKII